MTDAAISFHADLEAARDTAKAAWKAARANESAAWDTYRENDTTRPVWEAARNILTLTQVAYDQLDRACKTAEKVEADVKAVANVREQARKASEELAAQTQATP